MPPKILLIAYRFPPQGGVGVYRPAKLVKHWARQGVHAAVISGPRAFEPIEDATLLDELPPSLEHTIVPDPSPWLAIQRVRQYFDSRGAPRIARAFGLVGEGLRQLSAPDGIPGWIPSVLWHGGRFARRCRPDVVLATGPPFTAFVAGAALARRLDVPFVLDYRDPWTASYVPRSGALLADRVNPGLERRILGRAAGVVAAHRAIFRFLEPLMPSDAPRRLWMPNGYDPDDFDESPPAADPDVFTLTHTGSFFATRRNPGTLVDVLDEMLGDGSLDPQRFRLRLAGSTQIVEERCRSRRSLGRALDTVGYVPHGESVRLLQSSTANLVVADQGMTNYYTPGKFYEVLYAQRPVLLLSPPGTTPRLADRSRGCVTADGENRHAIRRAVQTLYDRWKSGEPLDAPQRERIAFFDREHQSRRLLRLLTDLVGARR